MKNIEKNMKSNNYGMYLLTVISIFVTDQLSKYYIEKNIKEGEQIEIAEDLVFITNVKNEGCAYGFLKNNKSLLNLITGVTYSTVCGDLVLSLKKKNKGKVLGILFVLGGGLGNIYSRYKKKYVTDFIYIKGKNAPIFNVADIFILIGSIIMVIRNIIDNK